MILKLLARHFKDANYIRCTECPISKAAAELFNAKYVIESVDILYVDGVSYEHEGYFPWKFMPDLDIARRVNFDDTVIREIELICTD